MKIPDGFIERMQAKARQAGPVQAVRPRSACKPGCEVCGGSGMYTYDLPLGHRLFGVAFRCPNRPTEADGKRVTWDDLLMYPSLERAVEQVQATLARGYGMVYVWGDVGIGKTMLLKATRSDPLARGVVLTDMLSILDNLRQAFDADNAQQELQRRQGQWIAYPTLLIDEFDRFKATEFAQERLYRVMDGRYDLAIGGENSVTVMCSNQPPTIYEPYLRSRIEDGRFSVVHVSGPDLRPGAGYGA